MSKLKKTDKCPWCGHSVKKLHNNVGGLCRAKISNIVAMNKGDNHNFNGVCDCSYTSWIDDPVNEDYGLEELRNELIQTIHDIEDGREQNYRCTPEEQGEINYKVYISYGWKHGESSLKHWKRTLKDVESWIAKN